uniref:Peptidyl-prolyl cis-trans isomerase n=1 Tax=Trichuris muris TaxID=70415 RepID=A0A5S6Q8Q3_TRIMR
MAVLVETTVGDLVFDLYIKERPRACTNFLKLCKSKYYNFALFFSIEANFVAQSGDPLGTGRGGESIFRRVYGDQARYFEMETLPPMRHTKRGTLSFVNNGDNMVGSQFFVTLAENITFLDEKHCVFGELAEGFETLDILNNAICDKNNRPYQEIRIMHTVVLEDPFPDPKGLTYPSRSPSPDDSMINTKRIGVDEPLVDDEGNLPAEAVEEEIAAREARTKAHVLEMVGDLHFAEEKPADNVLFICRLNAVTTEDDLAIIFGRFGEILSCEVIRDKVTGCSLQYAFVEFATRESCEQAYFKMDNVLIDDRRIHVDFGQSVCRNKDWRKQLAQLSARQRSDKRSKPRERRGSRSAERHRQKTYPERKSANRRRSRSREYKRSKHRRSPSSPRRRHGHHRRH